MANNRGTEVNYLFLASCACDGDGVEKVERNGRHGYHGGQIYNVFDVLRQIFCNNARMKWFKISATAIKRNVTDSSGSPRKTTGIRGNMGIVTSPYSVTGNLRMDSLYYINF